MRNSLLGGLLLTPALALGAPQTGMLETAPGVSIYYEKHGSGPKVTIIPARLFLARDFASLARGDRTLLFYDMRNRGASSHITDGSKLTILEDVKDLEALRAHFKIGNFDLVGWSYLGLMSALYASDYPERVGRLVQMGPVARQWPGDYPPEEAAVNRPMSDAHREAITAHSRARVEKTASQREMCLLESAQWAHYLVGDPANVPRVANNCQYENEWPDNLHQHLGQHFADIQKRRFPAAQFEKLKLPVLVIHGKLDVNAPYGAGREWAKTFPNARLITVERGAHDVWLDDPAVISDIGSFLDGKWPARAQPARAL